MKCLSKQSLSITSESTTEILFKKSKVFDKKKGDIYFISEWSQALVGVPEGINAKLNLQV